MRPVLTTILLGLLLSLPFFAKAAEDGAVILLTTVRFERPFYFPTPAGDPILIPPGDYVVEAQGTQELQLSAQDRTPVLLSAMPGRHEEELDRSFALVVPDATAPQLTHLVLALPDGRSFQSTGSADGVMPRLVPTHMVVAMLKTLMTGSPVKNAMQMEPHTNRPGKPYRSFTLFAGMCTLLCERDEDCRAFTWKRDTAKPVKGSCELMKDVPPKREDDCCVSGAKPAARTK